MKYALKTSLIIILLFLAVMVLAVGCGKKSVEEKSPKSETATVAPAETKDWKQVKSPDGKFSLKVPRDWEVKTAREMGLGKGRLFVAFGPVDAGYRTNLQASVETMANTTMSDYIAQFEKNTREETGTKELKILADERVDYSQGESYRKKYSYNAYGQNINLIFDVLYLKKGKNYYVIQVVTTEKLYNDVKKTFNSIFATIKIK